MSVLCAGDTHVFQVGSPTCDCGLWGAFASQSANPSIGSGPGPYPLYYPHGYNPFANVPPTAGAAPEIGIAQFKAAQLAGASHLSSDGKTIYVIRMGKVCWADWSEEYGSFGAWWPALGELPADAVAM